MHFVIVEMKLTIVHFKFIKKISFLIESIEFNSFHNLFLF